MTAAEYQQEFDDLTGQGYQPVDISGKGFHDDYYHPGSLSDTHLRHQQHWHQGNERHA